jgi:ectoine hydroxylase-related dioxygenase (phytanoyl-CoA dioxygenase family)
LRGLALCDTSNIRVSPVVEKILAAMHEFGFCVVPSVLLRDDADALTRIILHLQETEPRPDETTLGHRRVLHLLAKNPIFVELMCHPLTMAVHEAYLGPDFVCSTWSSNCVLPGADLTYWHVDHPYWTIAAPYQVDPPLTAHTIWCLTDMTETTGGTKFIAGSHRRAYLPEHNGDYDHEGQHLEAPAGSVIFAHGACWHSAGHNRSDSPRVGIFARYARSFIIPQEDLKPQLQVLQAPSELTRRLMGAKQYVPQRGYPY